MTNDNNNNSTEEEEPQFLVTLDCHHSHVMPGSQLLKKPVRRDPIDRLPYMLCPSCYRRERGACSIDPVHKIISVTAVPPPSPLKRKRLGV